MILVDGVTEHAAPGLRYKQWSHMVSTVSADELHQMADRLGLKRSWFQTDSFNHYDIVPTKRAMAIRFGAHEVTSRALLFCNYDYANRRKVRPCEQCAEKLAQLALSANADQFIGGCMKCDLSLYLPKET